MGNQYRTNDKGIISTILGFASGGDECFNGRLGFSPTLIPSDKFGLLNPPERKAQKRFALQNFGDKNLEARLGKRTVSYSIIKNYLS